MLVSPRGSLIVVALAAFACGSPSPSSSGETTSGPSAVPAASTVPSTAPVPNPTDASVSGTDDAGVALVDPPPQPFASKLYVLPQRSFEIADVAQAIDTRLGERGAASTVIVLVHGRSCGGGGEPDKSLGGVVPELESAYDAAVVLFVWPGSDDGCPLGFPTARAEAAGPALAYLARKVAFLRAAGTTKLGARKVVLLTHSMGNIVLEAALGETPSLPAATFDTLLLSSSATALSGHASWLARAGVGRRVYVTVNGRDTVLLAAGAGRGTRLGRALETESLTPGVTYADVTGADIGHQLYVPSGQKGESMKAFFRTTLRGGPYDPNVAPVPAKVEARGGATVVSFDGR